MLPLRPACQLEMRPQWDGATVSPPRRLPSPQATGPCAPAAPVTDGHRGQFIIRAVSRVAGRAIANFQKSPSIRPHARFETVGVGDECRRPSRTVTNSSDQVRACHSAHGRPGVRRVMLTPKLLEPKQFAERPLVAPVNLEGGGCGSLPPNGCTGAPVAKSASGASNSQT